ncbi:MAG TPA: 50S ribosomal protein L17 [bacterium]|nr:50S ribosomal protein L17 [bacterium]HYM68763.1 50S ribosomal protein L17 [bacterium]
MSLGQKGRRLGRDTGARLALFRGLVSALIVHERIATTEHKAKETKKIADRMIDLALQNDLHARRQVARVLPDRAVIKRLFSTVAPRYQKGRGGYTRVIRTAPRRGDAAPMALLELVK